MCSIAITKTFTVTKSEEDALVVNQKDTKDTLNFKIKHRYQTYDIDLDRESVEAIHKFLGEYLETASKEQFISRLSDEVPTFARAS